jgi:hypothetical protein
VQLGATITLIVTILIAAAGYLVTYFSNLRLARRKDRLERINRQLSDLYGPLYALLETSGRVWEELSKDGGRFGDDRPLDSPLTEEQAATWKIWMVHVFMPLTRRMVEVITDHGDLLIEDHLPRPLSDLCAHVIGYELAIARWNSDDFDSTDRRDHVSLIDFPRGTLDSYVGGSFKKLKQEQGKLLAEVNR